MTDPDRADWRIFTGDDTDRDEHTLSLARLQRLPDPPPWRRFDDLDRERARSFLPEPEHIDRVNAALYLRRPLLITGNPGTGKTTLVYAVARELGLGPVLRWSITSRSALKDGLYEYDAVARLQDAYLSTQAPKDGLPPADQDSASPTLAKDPADIGPYLTLGPLGTAFYANEHQNPTTHEVRRYPRVLLIDEIDKSDIDLPNDLLHVFEEGRFEIPELVRLAAAPAPAQPRCGSPGRPCWRTRCRWAAPCARCCSACPRAPAWSWTSRPRSTTSPNCVCRCQCCAGRRSAAGSWPSSSTTIRRPCSGSRCSRS